MTLAAMETAMEEEEGAMVQRERQEQNLIIGEYIK
jgi:hypothetical protein